MAMLEDHKTVIIGAGLFGLSLARELAIQGRRQIIVLDRHMPPVPDGSSNDISRVIRFDYADQDYLDLAYEAYQQWAKSTRYKDVFFRTPYVLACSKGVHGQQWIQKTTTALTRRGLPWTALDDATIIRQRHPILSGKLCTPDFSGYENERGGWADAAKAITQLRDDCIELGVSFITGWAGTVTGLEKDPDGRIRAVKTLDDGRLEGEEFVLAAGAWASSLVDMYNSTLSTAQCVAYMRLSDSEMERYKTLPIYTNSKTGWFNFPPHEPTRMLKMAVHGWGYTRKASSVETKIAKPNISAPQIHPVRQRPNFVPSDGETRLRDGLREILPELAERPFDRLILCWYTDTPTGDFIMDRHPDHNNLFILGGGSGHAFKFLPVLGKYTSLALVGKLPPHLAQKWRFRTEYQNDKSAFQGDGSRGGPERRELNSQERARL